MKVINIHKRVISQPIQEITLLFSTLATDHDQMLATDKWPRMKLDNGLQVGSKGGHGPIRYHVMDYQEGKSITFQFDRPLGFDGYHKFELTSLETDVRELKHTIDMTTTGFATIKWLFAIRWLHDAYIEDAFDKVENHFTTDKKKSEWSWWVKILRKMMTPRKNMK
jgi:hypothetical protein